VTKAVTGELDEIGFDRFFGSLTHRYSMPRSDSQTRRARHTLFSSLTIGVQSGDFTRQDSHSLCHDYYNAFVNTTDIAQRVTGEVMRCAGLTMLPNYYRIFTTAQDKDIPWDNGSRRFETLQYMAEEASRIYPSGLQILTQEPRLTDQYSTDLYREFDEIIAALEKFNDNPEYADDGRNGYQLSHRYYGGNNTYSNMVTGLRTMLDGPDNRQDADDFDEDFTRDPHSPEKMLVSELTSKWTQPSVLKAIVSAVATKERHAGLTTTGIMTFNDGYFVDIDPNVVNRIFNEGLDNRSIRTALADATFYKTCIPHAKVNNNDSGVFSRFSETSVPLNSVRKAYLFESGELAHYPAMSFAPISAYLDQVVDFDQAFKNNGMLKIPAVNGYLGYFALLRCIVFRGQHLGLYDHLPDAKPVTWRRAVTRIKGVPLRKVWELPLIVNPFRTVEEIFADLGYEIHEVIDPNAKAEAPVRKPGGKRK
jgi:hypothetical protein